jgi:hypothetical protein
LHGAKSRPASPQWLSPTGNKLQPAHLFGRALADEPHDPPHLLSNGVAPLRRYDDAGMGAIPLNSLLMQNAIIRGVVREQGSAERRRGRQMIVIFPVNHVRLGSRQYIHISRPQSEYKRPAHGVFIEIEPDLAHW